MPTPLESPSLSVAVIGPDDGELLRAGPVVHRVLEDGGVTGRRLGVVECRMPAGWDGPPQHIHHAHDETFFVLSGHVRFTTGAESHVLGVGGMFAAGIGAPHTFGNADADEPAALLLSVTPERYVGYSVSWCTSGPGPGDWPRHRRNDRAARTRR